MLDKHFMIHSLIVFSVHSVLSCVQITAVVKETVAAIQHKSKAWESGHLMAPLLAGAQIHRALSAQPHCIRTVFYIVRKR